MSNDIESLSLIKTERRENFAISVIVTETLENSTAYPDLKNLYVFSNLRNCAIQDIYVISTK